MVRRTLGKLLERYFRSFDPAFLRRNHPYHDLFDHGPGFDAAYENALRATKTPRSVWRRDRFFNMYSSLELVRGLEGDIAECGIWKGLSALIICGRMRELEPGFDGTGFAGFDSFEGLSAPVPEDRLDPRYAGMFKDTSIEGVRRTLAEFPGVALHKGWIPDVFREVPERRYRFAHIDVDLVVPTVASIEYFLPRMVPGGVIICDDYASKTWPGTKAAVDACLARHGARSMALCSSEILVIAK